MHRLMSGKCTHLKQFNWDTYARIFLRRVVEVMFRPPDILSPVPLLLPYLTVRLIDQWQQLTYCQDSRTPSSLSLSFGTTLVRYQRRYIYF